MDELDHEKIFNKIIFKELEPCVLNEPIIRKTIYEQGPVGEAGRLFRSDDLQYDKITILRLEFQNILKIDHLWILPNLQILSLAFNKIDKIENLQELKNLKELNLSYNMIEKLENLDELRKLEILSVFGNAIKKIENIDNLENLIIFSAGNNEIETTDGLERLRFLKKLKSLNLKGNEIERRDRHFRIFIAGLLPDLMYYEYIYVSKEEREEGRDRFRFKLREIMDNEKIETAERERILKEQADSVHACKCFVENLNQLFDMLFELSCTDEGGCLLEIGKEADQLKNDFRDRATVHTQNIQEIGFKEFEKRENELKIFEECIRNGRLKVQLDGQKIINKFLEDKEPIFKNAQDIMSEFRKKIKENIEDSEVETLTKETEQKIVVISEEFNKLFESTSTLMDNEMQLHESITDANINFENVMQDMMTDFLEKCKVEFVYLRKIERDFIDELTDAAQSYVTNKSAVGSDIPDGLKETATEKDLILKYIAAMKESHIEKIDGRQDQLLVRARGWIKELFEKLQTEEISRNRRKVMEINYFLDLQRELFDQITTMDSETLLIA